LKYLVKEGEITKLLLMRRSLFSYGSSLLLTCLLSLTVIAQDKIYSATDLKEGKVVEITQDKVKYKNLQNPGPVYSISRDKVLFIFNSAGGYLVMSQSTDEAIRTFLQGGRPAQSADLLFKNDGTRVSAEVENEDNQFVYLLNKGAKLKLDKSEIAAILYKNGQHKIFASDRGLVAGLLGKGQTAAPQGNATTAKAAAPPPNLFTAEKEPVKAREPVAEAKPQAVPVISREEQPATKPQPATAAVKEPVPRTKDNGAEEEMGVDFKEYEKKALQKTRELSDYIKVLCDKNTEYERAEKAIDQACLLFVGEDATVSVSSVSRQGVIRYKIREYLKKLKLVKYGRVEIEWTNIQYVSKLRKGPDGNYYGVITFEQVFRGYKDNEVVYSDVTRKNVEVVLKTYRKSVEGRSLSSWDVLLSDIGVVETKQS
jgi:bifunctional DNA-binding transcriptional regulator/antitoxin component of YhaV-PrlF toxin-antitoxin module